MDEGEKVEPDDLLTVIGDAETEAERELMEATKRT